MGREWIRVSLLSIFHNFISWWAFDNKFWWVNIAPFGLPVVPDVYRSAAKSSFTLILGLNKLSKSSKSLVTSPSPFAFNDKILHPISLQKGLILSTSELSQIKKDGFESSIK